MDTPIGKSVTKGTDADSTINSFSLLASKCEVIECSSIMLMGAHNRCSFEVTLKVNNKRFIATGPTIISAKKKASLAALRQMHNEGDKVMKSSTSKALDFGESSVENDMLVNNLSGLNMQETVNDTPKKHNSNNSFNTDMNCLGIKTLDPEPVFTTAKTADRSNNYETAKAASIELDPINSSHFGDNLSIDKTCVAGLDDTSEDSSVFGGEDRICTLLLQQNLQNDVNIPTSELLKSSVVLLTTDESSDSIPSIEIVNDVKKYVPVQNNTGIFQYQERLGIAVSAPDTILNQESIKEELQTESKIGVVTDAGMDAGDLEEIKNTINPKEIVKASQAIQNNRGTKLSVQDGQSPTAGAELHGVRKIIENDENKLTVCEPDSMTETQLNQLCNGVQSANESDLDDTTNPQDLEEDKQSNGFIIKEMAGNIAECNKYEENISCNFKKKGSAPTVHEGESLAVNVENLSTAGLSSILNVENSTEVKQEAGNPTKPEENFSVPNKNYTEMESKDNKENSYTEVKTPNPKESSNAMEILEEHINFCRFIETDTALHKIGKEEESVHTILNSKEICCESQLIEDYPLDVAVPIPEKNANKIEIDIEVDSFNVDETKYIVMVDNTASTEEETIQDPPEGEQLITKHIVDLTAVKDTCDSVTNSVPLSEEGNSLKTLEVNIDTIVVPLKENTLTICEKTNRNTISNQQLSIEYANPKGNFENALAIIEEVAETITANVETDLKRCDSTATKTNPGVTERLQGNTTQGTEETVPEGTSLHNYNKVCMMTSPLKKQLPNIISGNDCNVSTFAEMNKDCDFYQINESVIVPVVDLANSEDLTIIGEDSVPNPFAKKPNGNKIANKGSAKKKPLQKTNNNEPKVNTKLNSGDMLVKVEDQGSQGKENVTKKCVLNPFVKKIQTSNSATNVQLKRNSNYKTVKTNMVQNDMAVVDLVEEEVLNSNPAKKTMALKRKGEDNVMNPASKRIKLDVISAQVPYTVLQLDEDIDVNEENVHSIASESSEDLIPTLLETVDETGEIDVNREETIHHCLSILLTDDETNNIDSEHPSLLEKTTPEEVIEIDSATLGNNLNRCAKNTKKGQTQSKIMNRNPINLIDGVLEVPTTSKTKHFLITPKTSPPTSQLKKPKTPAKKIMAKITTKFPNSRPRFHPYKQRQRYLQEVLTIRNCSRTDKDNETADAIVRLNAICSGVTYQLESEMGPSHAPFFILSATFNGRRFYGHGKTKKLARLDAAKQILDTLDQGSTPKIQPINSDHKEQSSTSSNRNNEGTDSSEFDQIHNQQQQVRWPTNIQMANQSENTNNNNVLFPQARRVFGSGPLNSTHNFRRYVSPLPPRNNRIANVLPNNHQYVDQYSNNSGDSRFTQSRYTKNQRGGGTQDYNFGNASSRPYNFHFADQSSNNQPGTSNSPYNFHRHITPNYFDNFYNGGPLFNFPDPHYMLANILNGMSNNHQFSGHNPIQQNFNNRGDYDYHGHRPRRGKYFSRKNRKNGHYANRHPCNPEPNYESELTPDNQNQVNTTVDNAAPQPSRPRSQCMNPEPPTFHIPNQFPKGLLLPQHDSDIIEKLILEQFEQLTRTRPEVSNYKVLAGIVMTHNLNFQNAKVIAVATGTKCINGGNISSEGTVLNDSHAEVIARRCLMKFLYNQIKHHCRHDNTQESIFLRNPTGFKYAFTLKSQVQFHLYISTAPCGDARVFSSSDEHSNYLIMNEHSHGQLRTKVEGGMGTQRIGNQYLHQAWDGIQIGDPLHTMSCSDKIARWNVVGVQGGLLASLSEPIYFSSIVLGSMFNTRHLYRAVCGRLEQWLNLLPEPFRLNRPLLGQTSTTRMRRSTDITPCIGVNWTFGDNDIEIISLPAGREITNKLSQICKKVFYQKFISLVQNIPDLDVTQMPNIYAEVKLIARDFQKAKQKLFDAFQHAELGCWVKKPVEQNEFAEYF